MSPDLLRGLRHENACVAIKTLPRPKTAASLATGHVDQRSVIQGMTIMEAVRTDISLAPLNGKVAPGHVGAQQKMDQPPHLAMGHNLCLHVADEHPCTTYFEVHQGYRVLVNGTLVNG